MLATIEGTIVVPAGLSPRKCRLVTVELRDTTLADAPSTVVARQQLVDVHLAANGRVPFRLTAPDLQPGRALALRVHASMDGSGVVKTGDLLTTTADPVHTTGRHTHCLRVSLV